MRIFYLDNIKTLMIILVIFLHSAVTYSGIGSWFYNDSYLLNNFSYYFFLFFQAYLQSFFMSFLFFIGGYFVVDSLNKRGIKKYILARIYRLALPSLIFMIFIFPICEKITNPNFNLSTYFNGIITFKFIGWSGPLWFTLALLFFTFIYIVFKKFIDKLIEKMNDKITNKNLFIFISLIAIFAFLIRLVFPIGTSILNFQLCFFSAYIFMFLAGILVKKKSILEKIDYKYAKKYFLSSLFIGIPVLILLLFINALITKDINYLNDFDGGLHWMALLFAFWESFICISASLGLIGIFQKYFNKNIFLYKFLASNSFGVYVFHAPILIAVSILFKNIKIFVLFKFIIVALITVICSFIFSYLIKKIPWFKSIFS